MRLRLEGLPILILCMLVSTAKGQSQPAQITLDPATRFQTIDGFGVNFNGTYFREEQKPIIQRLVSDLGATIFRLDPYGLINWEAANDNADANVMDWAYYNDRYSIPEFEAAWAAGRYLNSLGIRPYLALSGIPPAWMLEDDPGPPHHKTCGKPSTHAHLNPQMYGEFAETVVSLAVYARNKAHVDFEYFGPVNETDCYPNEGPRIDPEEMPQVLKAVAARLQKEQMGDVKLVVAEQAIMSNDYIEQMLQHPDLMAQVGAFSLHSYSDTDARPHVEAVQHSRYPDVPVWLTEYGDLNDLDRSAENEWKGFSVAATRRVLRALNQGVSAGLYWDAFDNYHEHYPRFTYYGLVRNSDHVYTPKKRYYATRQLYHFVHPGAQRIALQSPESELVSGFVNGDDGSVVVVGVQEGGPEHLSLVLPGFHGTVQVYQTTRRLNCEKTSTVSVANGKAQVNLQKDSIFTLVFKEND